MAAIAARSEKLRANKGARVLEGAWLQRDLWRLCLLKLPLLTKTKKRVSLRGGENRDR